MAVNPHLAMLFAQLAMHQAPNMINSIKNGLLNNGGPTTDENIMKVLLHSDVPEALSRGYDIGLLDERSAQRGFPSVNGSLLDDFMPEDYPEWNDFPSDGITIDPNSSYEDLQDLYMGALNNEGPDMPATALASKMLMRNKIRGK